MSETKSTVYWSEDAGEWRAQILHYWIRDDLSSVSKNASTCVEDLSEVDAEHDGLQVRRDITIKQAVPDGQWVAMLSLDLVANEISDLAKVLDEHARYGDDTHLDMDVTTDEPAEDLFDENADDDEAEPDKIESQDQTNRERQIAEFVRGFNVGSWIMIQTLLNHVETDFGWMKSDADLPEIIDMERVQHIAEEIYCA